MNIDVFQLQEDGGVEWCVVSDDVYCGETCAYHDSLKDAMDDAKNMMEEVGRDSLESCRIRVFTASMVSSDRYEVRLVKA